MSDSIHCLPLSLPKNPSRHALLGCSLLTWVIFGSTQQLWEMVQALLTAMLCTRSPMELMSLCGGHAKFRLDSGVHPEGCCKPRHCRDTHEFKWTVKDGMIKRGSKGRVDGRFRRPGSSSIWNRLTSLSTTQAKQAFCCFKERAFQS